MADFGIGRISKTFYMVANTDAAKSLCSKIVPADIHVGDDGALIFPPSKEEELCRVGRAIIANGLSMEDLK